LRGSPIIGVTLGDPGSIGPEILLKALNADPNPQRYLIFGSLRVLQHHAEMLNIPFSSTQIRIEDVDNISEPYFGPRPKQSGPATIDYLERAFEFLQQNRIQGLLTGPIHKESWHISGYNYPGQTEYCASKANVSEFAMVMVGETFRVAVLSTHLSLRDALPLVHKENIERKLGLLYRELKRLGFDPPKIACAALNPHAGEAGAFGSEESKEIAPAIAELRNSGILVDGPIAPEVIFRQAAATKKWDIILSMYHDQAMIPIKLLDFERCANVTLGLPFIRTSPDHGTAFDIAGKGSANPGSMIYAMQLAWDWTLRTQQ
jgi:4-hydroxythreonine-4-phosphate dehydrogenase